MAQKLVRISFSSRNFVSGQNVKFFVYNKNGVLIYSGFGNELGTSGIYYVEGNLSFTLLGQEVYTIIAEEINGNWKAHRTITKNSECIIN